MKYGIQIPQGWPMLTDLKDPAVAYEMMVHTAQTAEACGYEMLWLSDHLMPTTPHQLFGFECWTTTAALARDTKRIRLGQEEVVQIILEMWTRETATFSGQRYQVHGAINEPKGVQKPHIPWLIAPETSGERRNRAERAEMPQKEKDLKIGMFTE